VAWSGVGVNLATNAPTRRRCDRRYARCWTIRSFVRRPHWHAEQRRGIDTESEILRILRQQRSAMTTAARRRPVAPGQTLAQDQKSTPLGPRPVDDAGLHVQIASDRVAQVHPSAPALYRATLVLNC